LDRNYPKEGRNEITKLDISNKDLEGELDLGEFKNLEVLKCSNNKLTGLNVSNCEKLKELGCYHNQLTQLILFNNNLEKLDCRYNLLTDLDFNVLNQNLTRLNLSNNDFSTRDLSCFSRLTELK
jgi:Leucine-rich repeat (LRR) protein